MATYIQDTLDLIDTAVGGYAETIFTGLGGPVTTTIQIAGVVGLAFIAINAILQWTPIRFTDYIKWGLRYVIILAIATSWAQFQPFYDILTIVPSSVGAELLSVTGAPTLNAALDGMVTNLFDLSEATSDEAGTFDFGMAFMAIILLILGALMACIAIIVSAIAKIGLAMAVSLAPIFIATLLFKGTSDLFTSWSRFTIGFAMIPLVLAGVMGAVIGVGEALITTPGNVTAVSEVAGFLIVVLAAIIMMSQVPTMVNGLAGTIVATTSGIREAQKIGDTAGSGMSKFGHAAKPRMAQAASAVGAGRAAEGGARGRVDAMLADAKRTQTAMKANRDRYDKRSAAMGQMASRKELREAGRAGIRRQARENVAERKDAAVNRLIEDGPATLHAGTIQGRKKAAN